MKRILLIVCCLLLLALAGCRETNKIIYEGVLKNVTTIKGTTTLTFVDRTIVTRYYHENYNPDSAIILGDVYDVVEKVGTLTNTNAVYLLRVTSLGDK